MVSLVVVSLLVAAPVKVAANRFNVVDLSEERADFYTEHFSDRLAEHGVDVVTPREIAAVLGLERQKQLLGCGEEASACIAEIAAALGVEGLLLGDVARVGTGFQVNLKVIDAGTSKRLATWSGPAATEAELVEVLTRAALPVAVQLAKALGRPLPAQALQPPQVAQPMLRPGARRWTWLPAGVAAVGLGFGIAGLAMAESARARLASEAFTIREANDLLDQGVAMRGMGYAGLAVAVTGLGVAAAFFIFGADTPLAPGVALLPGGGAVALSGRWP